MSARINYNRITGSNIQGDATTVTEPLGTLVVTNNGDLRLHDGTTQGGVAVSGSGGGFATTSTLVNGTYTVALSTTGQLNLPSAANTESDNARIQSANSIDILANLAKWTFSTNSNLTVPGTIVGNSGALDLNYDGSVILSGIPSVAAVIQTTTSGSSNTSTWTFGTDGSTTFPNDTILGTGQDPNVYIETVSTSTTSTWSFGTDGVLTLPAATPVIKGGGTGTDVAIIASTGTNPQTWTFGTDGSVTLPIGSGTYGMEPMKLTSGDQTVTLGGSGTNIFIADLGAGPGIYFRTQNNGHTGTQYSMLLEGDTGNLHVPSTIIGNSGALDLNYDGSVVLSGIPSVDAVIQTTNNGSSNTSTWTFGAGGALTLPQGSVIGETNNTTVITPPTANPGQSLVIRPTASFYLSASGYIVPGENLIITLTNSNNSSVDNTYINYTITDAVASQLGLSSLTGHFPYLSPSATNPQSASIVLPIPLNSSALTFTLTIDSDQPAGSANVTITVTSNGIFNNELSHVHLVAGNPSVVDLYLGDDDQYVKIEKNAGNVVVGTNSTATTSTWTFGTDGRLTFPDATVQTTAWTGTVAYSNVTGTPSIPSLGNFAFSGDTLSNTLSDASTLQVGGNNWTFGSDGGLTFPDTTVQTTAWTGAFTTATIINGSNQLRISSVPSTLNGASGDTVGDIAFDSNYIYYCINPFTASTFVFHSITTSGLSWPYLMYYATDPNPTTPIDWTGWTVTGPNGYSGTITGTSVNTGGSGWQIPVSPSILQQTGDYTFISPGGQIWTKTPWNALSSINTATTSTLGGVKIGSGITITGDGTISVAAPSLPICVINSSDKVSLPNNQVRVNFTVNNPSGSTITAIGIFVPNLETMQAADSNSTGTQDKILVGMDGNQRYAQVYATNGNGTSYSAPFLLVAAGICLLAGTMISLADGSYKAIEDITYTDSMLSWNFDQGCYAETKAVWIKRGETGSQYNLLTFSDGTTLRTFDQHRIFNKQAGAFTYPMTDATPIGTITVNEHGQEITLVDKQVIVDTIEYYNVITDYHMNLFSDSILTSCRFNNIYPITDMKFVKDGRTLRTRDEFENIPDRFFYGLRLAEQTTDIETVEWYVNRLLSLEQSSESVVV